jgi:hypothetical protein
MKVYSFLSFLSAALDRIGAWWKETIVGRYLDVLEFLHAVLLGDWNVNEINPPAQSYKVGTVDFILFLFVVW